MLLLFRYLGAIIGRTCDRIAEGKFSLEGADYQVPFSIWEWSTLRMIKTQFNKNMTATTAGPQRRRRPWLLSPWWKKVPLLACLDSFTVDLNEKVNPTKKFRNSYFSIYAFETSEAGTSACGRGGWIKTQLLSPLGISESDNM